MLGFFFSDFFCVQLNKCLASKYPFVRNSVGTSVVLVKTTLFFKLFKYLYWVPLVPPFFWRRLTFSVYYNNTSVCSLYNFVALCRFLPTPKCCWNRSPNLLFFFPCRTHSMPLIIPFPSLLRPLLEVTVPGMLMVLKMWRQWSVLHFLFIIPNAGFISECWQYSVQSPLVSYMPSWTHCSPSSSPLNLHHFHSSMLVITCFVAQSSLW